MGPIVASILFCCLTFYILAKYYEDSTYLDHNEWPKIIVQNLIGGFAGALAGGIVASSTIRNMPPLWLPGGSGPAYSPQY